MSHLATIDVHFFAQKDKWLNGSDILRVNWRVPMMMARKQGDRISQYIRGYILGLDERCQVLHDQNDQNANSIYVEISLTGPIHELSTVLMLQGELTYGGEVNIRFVGNDWDW